MFPQRLHPDPDPEFWRCYNCGVKKPALEFDGESNHCKDCTQQEKECPECHKVPILKMYKMCSDCAADPKVLKRRRSMFNKMLGKKDNG